MINNICLISPVPDGTLQQGMNHLFYPSLQLVLSGPFLRQWISSLAERWKQLENF